MQMSIFLYGLMTKDTWLSQIRLCTRKKHSAMEQLQIEIKRPYHLRNDQLINQQRKAVSYNEYLVKEAEIMLKIISDLKVGIATKRTIFTDWTQLNQSQSSFAFRRFWATLTKEIS